MRRGGLLSLSPAAYISANNRPAPAAGGVGSPPSSRPAPVVLTGAGVLGDRYVPTVGCKTPIADVLSGAACADVEVKDVPTVGCKTPIAEVLSGADCADADGMDVPTVAYRGSGAGRRTLPNVHGTRIVLLYHRKTQSGRLQSCGA